MLVVGRAGFEPATLRFLHLPFLGCVLGRLSIVYLAGRPYSRKLYQAELPPVLANVSWPT